MKITGADIVLMYLWELQHKKDKNKGDSEDNEDEE